jgi:hypothetical protein
MTTTISAEATPKILQKEQQKQKHLQKQLIKAAGRAFMHLRTGEKEEKEDQLSQSKQVVHDNDCCCLDMNHGGTLFS